MPSLPPSRPNPDSFTPPKGTSADAINKVLTPTIPASRPSAAINAVDRSRVKTKLANPYGVLFAYSRTSPSSANGVIGATGANGSSRMTCISG